MSGKKYKPLKLRKEIKAAVRKAVEAQPIIDMHTHLYPPSFGTTLGGPKRTSDPAGLLLWGVDELLTYHYLVAEVFRVVPASRLSYADFWKMSKQEQADHIWRHLFVERSPVSEACRGVLTCLNTLGLDAADKNLVGIRKWFSEQDPDRYIDKVMRLANVESITMTNAVFDDNERNRWLANPGVGDDPRFKAVLRFDPILRDWPAACVKLRAWGYDVSEDMTQHTIDEARRFVGEWIEKIGAIYCAVSLPPDFRYPVVGDDRKAQLGEQVLEKVVLPTCADTGLPFAMMIGSKLRVNPALGDAGDMVGKSDVASVVNLCANFPQNRFFCTMLARENQHELAVAARKFGNLMIFGCWWFLNNPVLIEELMRMRTELLGLSYIPQHSDARVLDQLLYKWRHSREILVKVLTDKYQDTVDAGWPVTRDDIAHDVALLLHDNFKTFLKG